MFGRPVTNFARMGLAVAAFGAAALPATLLFSGPAIGHDEAAAHAGHDAAPAVDGIDATRIAAGRELFASWSCSACHALSDAKASGAVGPSLDGDPNLTEEFVVSRVTNGQGAMPAFGGQMTDQEIADISYYIAKVSKK